MSERLTDEQQKIVEGPDPYTGRMPIPPGVGPGTQPGGPPRPAPVPQQTRNVWVAPFWVCSGICPRCGEGFVFIGKLSDDEPDPICARCEYATAWPTVSPELVPIMVELRWRLDQYQAATDVGSGASREALRAAFLKATDGFWTHGAQLLEELERVFGDQVQAGVAAIEGGVSGVEVKAES